MINPIISAITEFIFVTDEPHIRSHHKSHRDNNKPFECGISGEAVPEAVQNFFNVFQHDILSYTGKYGSLTTDNPFGDFLLYSFGKL